MSLVILSAKQSQQACASQRVGVHEKDIFLHDFEHLRRGGLPLYGLRIHGVPGSNITAYKSKPGAKMRRGGPHRAAGMSRHSIQLFRINTNFYFRGGFGATSEQGSKQRLGAICAGYELSDFRTAIFDIFYFCNILKVLMTSENRMI